MSEPRDDPDARLADALERVAHGAVVSVPSILGERALTLAFTAVLTNGFSAGAYGVFALSRRLQRFLLRLSLGFRSGLSRFLPNTDSREDRDVIATFAALLIFVTAGVFGLALFFAAPVLADATGQGHDFGVFLRLFALGLPAAVWLRTAGELLRAFEEVGPLNLAVRVAFPLAQLLVGVVGVFYFDLAAVAVGVWVVMGLVGIGAVAWVAFVHDLRPRIRAPNATELREKYLRFTAPLFVGGFATTTQRLGFYPLIAVFLSGTAGGVFAVGVLLGGLVRLPLMGINQFIPPIAAALNDEGHREALKRLYHVTSRLVLVCVTALSVPVVVYREPVMRVFGPAFVPYAYLLPGFVLAQFAACAAGSVGILLTMTDNQRALLVTNTALTLVLAVVSVPLTALYGLPGLVFAYLLMLTLNNGMEVVVLYYLEGLQPFTRAHTRPLVAAVPFVAVALAVQFVLPSPLAPVAGTLLGLAAYTGTLLVLGFDPAERELVAALTARYRNALG